MTYNSKMIEERTNRRLEAGASFAHDIIIAKLGVVHVWGDGTVSIYKYGLTADDVVEMVIIGNKYNMKGVLEMGNNSPSGGGSIDVVFRYHEE